MAESPFAEVEPVVDKDVNLKSGKLRLRTVLTVSILAGIVMLSYTLMGALRVQSSFFAIDHPRPFWQRPLKWKLMNPKS